jgi:predicted AAA+ superfamily ATPase
MNVSLDDVGQVLARFNPWWRDEPLSGLPLWQRAAMHTLLGWLVDPPVHRATLLSGARQVGKTTLLLQVVRALLAQGVPPSNILYVTFDHPLLRVGGITAVLQAWRSREPQAAGPEFLLLDEMQCVEDFGSWIKHEVDFNRQRRIVFTGSAMPLLSTDPESGVGRWHTLALTTLSFYEYLQIKKIDLPEPPALDALHDLFAWPAASFARESERQAALLGHYHTYLVRGGFPQTAQLGDVVLAQRLLREDILDKVLRRDMTALFGVRRVMDLEYLLLYLCMHEGGLLDVTQLCDSLAVKRPTALHYLSLLEACHLIYRLYPFGYGKDVLRAKCKVYLADPAIAPAVLLKGNSLLDDPAGLGQAAEASVHRHLHAWGHSLGARFSYWRAAIAGRRHSGGEHEVDLLVNWGADEIPIEVKYRTQHLQLSDLKGLQQLCATRNSAHAYVITKQLQHFGPVPGPVGPQTAALYVPAALLCYWLGRAETSPAAFSL